MRSQIEITAEYRSGPRPGSGRTVVHSIRGGHHFAGRETGPGLVHLIGTAAGPLGGDDVSVLVTVGAGARLAPRSPGATIVQPGREVPGSRLRLELIVGDDAELDVAFEPTVICHQAEHTATARLSLSGSGRARLLEHVLLGRTGEPGGGWTGRTAVTRDGTPQLRHTLRSSVLAGDGTRVVSTLLHSGPFAWPFVGSAAAGVTPTPTPGVTPGTHLVAGPGTDLVAGLVARSATCGTAVAMPLAAGGLLVTATGTTLIPVQRDLLAAAAQATAIAELC